MPFPLECFCILKCFTIVTGKETLIFYIPKTLYKAVYFFSVEQNNISHSSQEMYIFSKEVRIGYYGNVAAEPIQ